MNQNTVFLLITAMDYVMGDVNGNGKVDIGDAVTIEIMGLTSSMP